MKYLVSLLIGVVTGAALLLLGLYFNPFNGQTSVSPLAVTDARVVEYSFSAVPGDGLLYTNNGDSTVKPHPAGVDELWEPAIDATELWVTLLQSSRGNPAGIGIKFSSKSEQTRLLNGQALANSVWHIYLPGQGTLLIDQTEDYWNYLREVVVPARLGSSGSWRGTFNRIMTVGPGSLGTARVTGGSGLYTDLTSESVESLSASAYSADSGPVAFNGRLTIALPSAAETETE